MHSENGSSTDQEPRDRKTTKPIMEKRRRARINASLTELKSLLIEAIKKEGTRHNKMEKADILEMTVKHLRQMQRQQFTAAAAEDPSVLSKYRIGFNECAKEVKRFLTSMQSCDADLKTRLLNHIADCLSGVGEKDTKSLPTVSAISLPPSPAKVEDGSSRSWSPLTEPSVQADVNNNVAAMPSLEPVKSGNVFSGLQVIPTQLASGEIAFVLPTNIIRASPTPSYMIPVFTGTSHGTNVCTTPSVQRSSVDNGVSGTCHTNLPKSSVSSTGTDKSYLPCATVTPVKAVSQQSLTNSYVIEKPVFATGSSCLRPDNAHAHDDMVWRPW